MSEKIIKPFIEYNVQTGVDLTPEEQEDPYLMVKALSTECRDVSEEEIAEHETYFKENGKCKTHLIHDTPTFLYDSRDCVICGKFIAFI